MQKDFGYRKGTKDGLGPGEGPKWHPSEESLLEEAIARRGTEKDILCDIYAVIHLGNMSNGTGT